MYIMSLLVELFGSVYIQYVECVRDNYYVPLSYVYVFRSACVRFVWLDNMMYNRLEAMVFKEKPLKNSHLFTVI